MGDGFDAVFSAILAQIADGAVGNNQPAAAIPVANDAGLSSTPPQGAALSAAGNTDSLAAAGETDSNTFSPENLRAPTGDAAQTPIATPVTGNKRIAAPVAANINAAATVSLLEAQAAAVPAPKTTNAAVSADAQRTPKQNKSAATTSPAPDPSLLLASVAAPVAPTEPAAPTIDEPAAPLAATAPNAALMPQPPVGDGDSDGSDDDDTPVSQTSGAGAAASADQTATASGASDFLADLKANQAWAGVDATPPQNGQNPQFTATTSPARKAAPAPAADAPSSGAKATGPGQKSDANTTALTRLAANDQDATDNAKGDAANAPAQPATPVTADAPPSPSPATLSNALNNAANSAGALQQPGQAGQSAPTAVTLHVAPQLQSSHAATTSGLDSLAVNIAAKSLDGIKHFDIRLDPPELGRVEVRLSVDDAGRAQASLSADRPQTLQLLQNDASNINRALRDAGLNLSDNGLSFSLRGQDRQAGDNQPSQQQRGRSLSVRALASVDAAVSGNSSASLAPDSAGVDIRV